MLLEGQQLFGCLPWSQPADPVAPGSLTSTADGHTSTGVSCAVTRVMAYSEPHLLIN